MAALAWRCSAGTFEVDENWAKIPDDIVLGDVAAGRGGQPGQCLRLQPRRPSVAKFDSARATAAHLGRGRSSTRRMASMSRRTTFRLIDDGDHSVRHCTLDGKVLLTLGIPGHAFAST